MMIKRPWQHTTYYRQYCSSSHIDNSDTTDGTPAAIPCLPKHAQHGTFSLLGSGPATEWDRDYNAARNILYCFLYERAFAERPRLFKRGTNTVGLTTTPNSSS
ncbi:hypothetical protein SeMB42_g00287 [Synchytrium endobioticum]|uniref:Uncharacterized protein n=1 Tax=Synchytrium endobioticum TaxID=286115 RepID=A0A507DSC6_9FUNG|nr:hypothetical protein SeLEV6574_g00410 [Synchytrium endobioticum]TPX54436.1 hypothetical protein SeMB42_g00287 [Synchytrium endobioticum]